MKFEKSLLLITMCGLFTCCIVQHQADTTNSESARHKSREATTDPIVGQFGNKELWDQLLAQAGIEKPFAWEAWEGKEKGLTIIGVDQHGNLKKVEAVMGSNGYVITPSQVLHESNIPAWTSGDLDLTKYLPDTEFPFRSYVVSTSNCNVHFILLWQALNRSFEKRSLFIDAINLRIIVEENGTVVSNKLQDLLFQSIDQTLVEDVNKDGKPDILVIGVNRLTFVNIWTVGANCSVAPLLFQDGDHGLQSARDKELFLSKNKSTGRYDIHVTHYEPITKNDRVHFEVTESIYEWDLAELVYKVSQRHSYLRSADGK